MENYYLVYLKVSKNAAKIRVHNRRDHFMPDILVDGQFSTLEEPDVCVTLHETLTSNEMISRLTSIINLSLIHI